MATITSLEPGAYHGVPEALYHSLPYVSSSFLKKFKDCPADALLPVEKTACMELGSALHSYILEGPEAFDKQYTFMLESDLNKNTKEYKALAAEFAEANSDKKILPATTSKVSTKEVIESCHASIQAHPAAAKLLSAEGASEVTLIWDDPTTGLRCKARLDFITEGVICDLKKTQDVKKFRTTLVSYNYDIQAAWYLMGAEACGLDAVKFVFIAIEAEAPYKVATGVLSDRWIEYAKNESNRLLGLVNECKVMNYFPAYEIPSNVTTLAEITGKDLMVDWDMPSWR